MVDGQNLNFAIPIAYVSPLISDAPAKPFQSVPPTVVARKPHRSAPRRLPRSNLLHQQSQRLRFDPSELNGTYTGIWQSTVYAASGAAVMTISTQGKTVHAEIALTGGQVIRDTLTGEASEVGGGWSVTLRTASREPVHDGHFQEGCLRR